MLLAMNCGFRPSRVTSSNLFKSDIPSFGVLENVVPSLIEHALKAIALTSGRESRVLLSKDPSYSFLTTWPAPRLTPDAMLQSVQA